MPWRARTIVQLRGRWASRPQLKRGPLGRAILTLYSTYIVRTLTRGADPRRMGPREGADQPAEAWRVLRGSGDGLLR